MDKTAISKVNKHVCRKFPEFLRTVPKIKSIGENFQLSYSTKVQLPDGKWMNRNIRVTTDEFGKVIKLSTSK
jgi:hypothetical protein